MNLKQTVLKVFGIDDSKTIRNLRGALKVAEELRDPDDRFAAIVADYPLLVDLAKAYIRHEEWDSAQDIIRVCFQMRDDYAQWSGRRDTFLLRNLTKAFISHGREDIAQHIMMKIKNFENGVPTHALSTTIFPDDLIEKSEDKE